MYARRSDVCSMCASEMGTVRVGGTPSVMTTEEVLGMHTITGYNRFSNIAPGVCGVRGWQFCSSQNFRKLVLNYSIAAFKVRCRPCGSDLQRGAAYYPYAVAGSCYTDAVEVRPIDLSTTLQHSAIKSRTRVHRRPSGTAYSFRPNPFVMRNRGIHRYCSTF
ncbi:hypothetical protein BD413DRAFT_292794 [Trametes elegans]|nr:hypothetical protein BD413DRAFT_292794 [Trametes elegans]